MTISVCMSTYNGEKYIEEQLISILHQTRKPDEVILCDDGSEDGTVARIRFFIDSNHLQGQWKLYDGKQNRGYPDCYYHAMELCTKEIVFLADQDDVWNENKLQKMSEVFSKYNEVQVVACKFGLIDAQGNNIRTVMAPSRENGTGSLRAVTIHDVLYKNEWPGMVMAYRREWYQGWKKASGIIPHDFLISVRAAEEGAFLQMDEELAYHRRHDGNTANEEHRIKRLLSKERKIQEIRDYTGYLDAFIKEKVLQTEEGRCVLKQKQKAMSDRYDALCSGKIRKVLKSAMDNRDHVRLATLICDILICKQKGV